MRNKRLGEFNFCDYSASWISIALLLLFSITSIVLELPFLVVLFPTAYAMLWLGVILAPHREQFVIDRDFIAVFKGKKARKIYLPSELTLVISYADVCPPLAMRTAVGNQTHILKDKFAISILQKMPAEVALEALHRNHVKTYTTSRIQTVFDGYRYIYSFVGSQFLLEQLIANRICLLVVPESLLEVISFDPGIVNLCIDTGY